MNDKSRKEGRMDRKVKKPHWNIKKCKEKGKKEKEKNEKEFSVEKK